MRYKLYIYILLLIAMNSCSSTKYVTDGNYLLDNVNVEVDGKYMDINMDMMRARVRQNGNSRWFSTLKIPLYVYSLSGRDTTKWINRLLRSIGEPPVIYDSAHMVASRSDLRTELNNIGYLGATIDIETKKKKKKLDVIYILHPGKSYFINNVSYIIKDSVIEKLLCNDTTNKILFPNTKFSVKTLDDERKRITNILNDNGYYKFNKDYVTFIADTAYRSNLIDLTLYIHPYRDANGQDTLHPRFKVRSISYAVEGPVGNINKLRSSVLKNNTGIRTGDYFSSRDLQKTYNHFGRLQAVKYTNVSFAEDKDSSLLDCFIHINMNKPSTISFQPEGTNTAGDLGAAVSMTYQNRNLFHGSEILSVELRGAFEAIRGLEGYANDNYEEYSIKTGLMFPRFIAPFLSNSFLRSNTATSEISLLYDLQNRPEYHRRVFSVSWRYNWSNTDQHNKYKLDLIDLNYVFMPWISDKFRQDYLEDENSRNAILRYNYEDLFIMRLGFGYTYNNGVYAIKTNIETAGNFLNASARLLKFSRNEQGQYELFNIAFAQYVKGDFDYTHNIKFDYNNSLVWHFGFGIAYPYGNSNILPFEKRYFSGGANSVRGWNVRGLGPGKYVGRDGNIDFINQTGDLKLDINMEYRAHLFWKLNGALFIDAGNIWTLRNYEDQLGGQFHFKDFIQQLAVSYGLGFRFNFDYFILRFDFGMKAINPAYDGKDHYPIINPRLKRDLAFHFAVGLPF